MLCKNDIQLEAGVFFIYYLKCFFFNLCFQNDDNNTIPLEYTKYFNKVIFHRYLQQQ